MQDIKVTVSPHNKFRDLMSTLTHRILQDPANQYVIYECLNSNDLKQLFDSLRDYQSSTRITAAFFICQLIKGNNKIIQSLLLRQGCQTSPLPCNYMIGLDPKNLPKKDLFRIMAIANKQKFHPQFLCWYINKTNFEVGQVFQDQQNFAIDPKDYVIGISLTDQQSQKVGNTVNSSNVTSRNSFQSKNRSIRNTPSDINKRKYMAGKYK